MGVGLDAEQIENWNPVPEEVQKEWEEDLKLMSMTPLDMVKEFARAFSHPINYSRSRSDYQEWEDLKYELIFEELDEWEYSRVGEDELKELADIIYVVYGYAAFRGWDLDEALRRVHVSNMSKLGPDGKPMYRNDGKVLKGPNYKKPELGDLV